MNYSICPFRLVSEEIWYASNNGLQPQEVLSKVTEDDFLRQNKKLFFTDKSREHVFSHVCLDMPEDGVAVMKIANRYVDDNDHMFWNRYPWEDRQFTTVVIVSRKEGMCFVVEENEKAFASINELLDILCRGLNDCLVMDKLAVVPTGEIIRQRDEYALMSACAVIGRKIDHLLEQDNTRKEVAKVKFDEHAILAAKLFTCTLVDSRKASMVISLLYELTKCRSSAKTILCPLRAAIDAGVMERPSYKDFIAVFGCGDIVSKKVYSDYTKHQYNGFQNMLLYKNAKIAFLKIKGMSI